MPWQRYGHRQPHTEGLLYSIVACQHFKPAPSHGVGRPACFSTGVGYSLFQVTAASRFGNRRLGALSHRRGGAALEIPLRVAIHREVNKLSHNERTKADWPLTRGALFCYRKPDGNLDEV
jgi:hypothetical protein